MTDTPLFPSPEWFSRFQNACLATRADMLTQTAEKLGATSPDTLGDYPRLVYETSEALQTARQPDAATRLLEAYAFHLPGHYAAEPADGDLLVLDAALHRNDEQIVRETSERLLTNFPEDAEILQGLVDRLRLWGHPQEAALAARRGLNSLTRSNASDLEQLIFFQNVLHEYRIEATWRKIKEGGKPDFAALKNDLEDIAYDTDASRMQRLQLSILHGFASPNALTQALLLDRDEALRVLGREFAAHMATTYRMAFVCSDVILVEIMNLALERADALAPDEETADAGTAPPADALWRFSAADIEEYIASHQLGFGAQCPHRAAALVWGLPHFLDFLRKRGFIDDATHRFQCEEAFSMRRHLTRLLAETLWRYAFVHQWGRPEEMPADAYDAERAAFENTWA